MRIFKTMFIAAMVAGLYATSASALITVEHTSNAVGEVAQGGTFDVDITLTFDGTPDLAGVFTSAGWDPTELQLVNATTPPFAVLFGPQGFLSQVAAPGQFPGDPAGTLRTIQFAANPGQQAGAGSELITTLTFEVIGGLDGTADVDVIFNSGDAFIAPTGATIGLENTALLGTSVSYTPVPEPGTALLMGLGLTGLTLAGRRR